MLMYRCRRKCIGDLRKKRAQEAGQGNCEFYDIVLSGRIVISLESVLHALETLDPEVKLDEEMRQRAKLPLQRMLELAQ